MSEFTMWLGIILVATGVIGGNNLAERTQSRSLSKKETFVAIIYLVMVIGGFLVCQMA